MADSSVQASDQVGVSGAVFSTDLVGGEHVQLIKLAYGAYGTVTVVDSITTNPFPVALSAIDNAVLDVIAGDTTSIDGKITACNTNAVVISSGTLTANLGTIAGVATEATVGGLLTDTELRATPVPVSGTVTASGPVTDTELRATPVPVSGTLTAVTTVTAVTDITNVVSVDDNAGSITTDIPAITTGGATPGKLISAATTNATSIKASSGTLYSLQVFNTNAAARYLKLYNKASAPTVGTDVPVQVYTIPGNTAGAGLVVPIPSQGIAFGTGLALATTTGAADADTAAVALNEIIVSYSFA